MNDRVRIERLQEWFELQLQFADVFATRARVPLDFAVTFYTNLHRRFGFGRPMKDGWSSQWDVFVRRLVSIPTGAERLAFTSSFAHGRMISWAQAADRSFGCFSFDPPNDGIVRIHFLP